MIGMMSWSAYYRAMYSDIVVGPVGSNHGSLARARARGAGSPRTAQSLLLSLLGRYRTQTMRAMGLVADLRVADGW